MAYAEIVYRPGSTNDEELHVLVGGDNDSPDAQSDAANRTRELFRTSLTDILQILGTDSSATAPTERGGTRG